MKTIILKNDNNPTKNLRFDVDNYTFVDKDGEKFIQFIDPRDGTRLKLFPKEKVIEIIEEVNP